MKEGKLLNKEENDILAISIVNYFLIDKEKAFAMISYYLKYINLEAKRYLSILISFCHIRAGAQILSKKILIFL